jgi:hypothetical protein
MGIVAIFSAPRGIVPDIAGLAAESAQLAGLA